MRQAMPQTTLQTTLQKNNAGKSLVATVHAVTLVAFFAFFAFIMAFIAPLAISVFAPCTAHASDLNVSPQAPKPASTVTLRYKPDSTWVKAFRLGKADGKIDGKMDGRADAKNELLPLYVFSYHFSESAAQPTAFATMLKPAPDGTWTATLTFRAEDVYVMYKVTNLAREDRNNSQYWETFIAQSSVSASGTTVAVPSANLRAALTYLGDLPQPCLRAVDFSKALSYLRQEIALYPSNLQAQVGESALAFELRELDEKTYRERTQKLMTMPFDSTKEHYVRAMTRFLNAQGKPDEALRMEDAYIKRFPRSETAEERAFREVRSAQGEDGFFEAGKKYLASFPTSYPAYELQGNLMMIYARRKKLPEGAQFLDSQKFPSPLGYNELAKLWYFSDTAQQSGLRYAQKAVELAQKALPEHKPVYFTDIEWRNSTTTTLPLALNTLGAIEFQLGRDADALRTLRRSIALGTSSVDTYAIMLNILNKQRQFSEAYDLARQASYIYPKDTTFLGWHKAMFDTLNTMTGEARTALFNAERRQIADSALRLRLLAMSAARLNLPAPKGQFTYIDGKKYGFEQFRGKPSILVLWSSWCQPCSDMLVQLNIFNQSYDKEIDIIALNVWEPRGKDRIGDLRAFYKKSPMSGLFLAVDDRDEIVKALGATGLPMIYFLDRNGRIQYQQPGFQNPLPFYETAAEILALLRSDGFYATQP
jgi:thiol-disulfide isomerase/thioredoxin